MYNIGTYSEIQRSRDNIILLIDVQLNIFISEIIREKTDPRLGIGTCTHHSN